MAKGKGGGKSAGGGRNDNRPNGKASKKHPKVQKKNDPDKVERWAAARAERRAAKAHKAA